MNGQNDNTTLQKQQLIQLLNNGSMRELVIWLDQQCCAGPVTGFACQAMVRAMIPLGYALMDLNRFPHEHPVWHTLQQAELFVLEPSETHHERLQMAATLSYPYGPGEGCLSLPDSPFAHGEPGDGCLSGSGTLVALGLDEQLVMELVRHALLPWLNGTGDPVIAR